MLIRMAARQHRTWILDSRRWDHYRRRDGDIIIATYPKCGTTWMQRIVQLLVFQSVEAVPLMKISPWIERRFPQPATECLVSSFQRPEGEPGRRNAKNCRLSRNHRCAGYVARPYRRREVRYHAPSWQHPHGARPAHVQGRQRSVLPCGNEQALGRCLHRWPFHHAQSTPRMAPTTTGRTPNRMIKPCQNP